jgi:uncharacterized protein (TIGR00251 family)
MTSRRRFSATEDGPFTLHKTGVRVAVRLQPGAARDSIDGLAAGADGVRRLTARVRAVPEKGKANAALVKLLAKTWRLPPSTIVVASGATGRNKIVEIEGGPDLLARLQRWGDGL